TGVPPSYSRAGDLSSTTTVLLSVTSHGHREVWPVLQPCIQRLLVREQGRTAVVLPCDRVLALIVDYHRRAPLVQSSRDPVSLPSRTANSCSIRAPGLASHPSSRQIPSQESSH